MSSEQPAGIYPLEGDSAVMRYWNGRVWDLRPIASVGTRAWAFILDLVMVSLIWLVVLVILALIGGAGQSQPLPDALGILIVFVAPVVAFTAYFAVFFATTGRTLGMLLGSLYLINLADGTQRLSWGRALLRALVLLVGVYFVFTAIIWFVVTAASKWRQGPHDLAAKTVVLRQTKTRKVKVPATPFIEGSSPIVDSGAVATSGVTITNLVESLPPDEKATVSDQGPVIFISHATEDAVIASTLSDELESQGIGTWLASRDVGIGTNYAAEIVRAVNNAQYLLVILSPASIESPHVRREVSIAIDRHVPVLPVSTDPTGEFMANLPVDWTYWLSLAQVFRMSDAASTAAEIARRVN